MVAVAAVQEDDSAMQAKPKVLPSLLLWRREPPYHVRILFHLHGIKPELSPGILFGFAYTVHARTTLNSHGEESLPASAGPLPLLPTVRYC